MALILLSVLMADCGGHHAARHGRSANGGDPNPVVFGGSLVPIGGGRSLYLKCRGNGSPTVILEAGSGAGSEEWREVQPWLGRATHTCAYDRAGLGNSLPDFGLPFPGAPGAAHDISDLERLLDHAGIASPYVLVGHSYGGLLVRLFARAHPRRTAGMVLVDADALDAKVGALGDTPLVIITRGSPIPGGPPVSATVRRQEEQRRANMQDGLAALSADHLHVVALPSGYGVQPSLNEQPGVVIAAVLAVLNAVRTRRPLAPCPAVFHGPGMQCRG